MSEGDGGEHGVRAVRQAMVMTRQASGGGRLEPGGPAAAGDISMVNAAANPLLFMQSRQWHLLILSCLRANSPSTISLAESNTLFFSSHRYLANQIPSPLVFFCRGSALSIPLRVSLRYLPRCSSAPSHHSSRFSLPASP